MARSLSISSFKQVPWGLLWMLLFFVLAEVCMRLVWHPFIVGEKIYCRFDTSYNYGYIDNQPHWIETGEKIILYPTQYLNYHKQQLTVEKKSNDRRAFVLGGSVSRGAAEGNYSFFLQTILSADKEEGSWSIVNLSADGAGSGRMLLLLKHIFQFEPDVIILHVHGSNEYEDERDDYYRRSINAGTNKLLFQSHFFVILKKTYSYLSNVDVAMAVNYDDEITATKDPKNFNRWLAMIDVNLGEMVRLCKQRHIPVILLGRAEKRDGEKDNISPPGSLINAVVKKHIQENIFYFDTPIVFFEENPFAADKGKFFVDETHWTEEGHRLIANKLALFLKRNELVK